MDNLTHSLLGIALSRAGLNRITPQAGWLMLMAVNAPDLDIVTGLRSNAWYIECHRGVTHSLVYAPLMALVPMGLWSLFARRHVKRTAQWVGAYIAALIGVISHILLDWLNVYGTRMLLPFSKEWLRLDLVYIIDLWLWAILFLGVGTQLLAKLVSSEIGAKPGTGRPAAWAAIIAIAAYLAFRSHMHALAVEALDARVHLNRQAQRVAAFPTPLNPWLWRGVAETPDFYRAYEIHLGREFDPDAGRTLYKIPASPAIEAARETESAKAFLGFTQFPLWQVVPSDNKDGGEIVTLTDLRFGLPEDRRFMVTVELDANRRVISQSFDFGSLQPK